MKRLRIGLNEMILKHLSNKALKNTLKVVEENIRQGVAIGYHYRIKSQIKAELVNRGVI